MLYYKGRVDGIKKREYQGKQRFHLQFVMPNETGEISFLEVRVPETIPMDRFKLGVNVEFPVEYSLVNGEVYFKVSDKVDPSEIKVSSGK